jgi:hypothetical protein
MDDESGIDEDGISGVVLPVAGSGSLLDCGVRGEAFSSREVPRV